MHQAYLKGVLAAALITVMPFPGFANAATGGAAVPAIAMSNPATPGVIAAADLAHAKVVRRTNARIIVWLNKGDNAHTVPLLRNAAADRSDAWAAKTLGSLYQAGLGVRTNPAQSFHWYLQAAQEGDRFAQRQVANAYLNGHGVARNPRQAAFWVRQGMMVPQVVDADYALGNAYAQDGVVPGTKNPPKASWYQKRGLAILERLDRQKVGVAAYDLGIVYLHGYGVPKDINRAKTDFRDALNWHYPPAATPLHQLEAKKA